jgi:membrane-associated phospholipid phosphatase
MRGILAGHEPRFKPQIGLARSSVGLHAASMESTPPLTTKLALARWISIVGHPFSFTALLVAVVGSKRSGVGGATRLIIVTAIVLIIPLWIFMWRKWRSGRWQTVDASDPADRPSFYGVALLLVGLLMGCFALVQGWSFMLRGCAAVAILLGLAAFLNRWIKLSNHVAFAMFTGVLLSYFALGWGVAVLLLVPFVAWSRLVLSRHTWSEVLGGIILGAAVGAGTVFL